MNRQEVNKLFRPLHGSSFYRDYLEQSLDGHPSPMVWLKKLRAELDTAIVILEDYGKSDDMDVDDILAKLERFGPKARAWVEALRSRMK